MDIYYFLVSHNFDKICIYHLQIAYNYMVVPERPT